MRECRQCGMPLATTEKCGCGVICKVCGKPRRDHMDVDQYVPCEDKDD